MHRQTRDQRTRNQLGNERSFDKGFSDDPNTFYPDPPVPIVATLNPDGTTTVGHGVPTAAATPVNPGHVEEFTLLGYSGYLVLGVGAGVALLLFSGGGKRRR